MKEEVKQYLEDNFKIKEENTGGITIKSGKTKTYLTRAYLDGDPNPLAGDPYEAVSLEDLKDKLRDEGLIEGDLI